MLFVIEKIVDGKMKYDVTEADFPPTAMVSDPLNAEEPGFLQKEGEEVSITGIYEVGQTNQLLAISRNHETHRFYQQKIAALGYDPITFKKK